MNKHWKWREFRRTIRLLGNKKVTYILTTCLCNVIGSVCYNIVLAIVMQKVLDGIAYRKEKFLYQAVMIALISFLVAFIFEPILARTRNHCVRSTISQLRKKVFCSITGMPVRTYETMEQGDILTKATNDVEAMEQIYLNHVPNLCFALIHGGIAILLMLFYNIWLGAVSLLLGAMQAGINYRTSGKVKQAAEKRQQSRADMMQEMIDTLDGSVDIKVSRSERFFSKKFGVMNQRLKKQEKEVEEKKILIENADNFFENLNYVVILGIGLYMVLNGTASLGIVVAIISLQGNATYLFHNMSAFMAGIAEALPSANRIMDLISIQERAFPTFELEKGDSVEAVEEVAIEMQNMCFSYDGYKDVLNDLSCVIERGKLVVVTGNSGAGKSTWIKILLGFYDFQQGKYFLFGKDTKILDKRVIKSLIAYVDQACYLFHMSVKENVRMGSLDASDEDVIAACKAAGADEFIEALPDGYDTILLNGENLSGGQKQRIALARAFVSQKPILLIDEGTASLDLWSEKKVIDSVVKMKGKRTIIIVSHKKAWIECADQVYQLRKMKFV